MKYTLPKIFQNKYFLYTVTLLAIGNIMGYLANEKYDCLSFFLAVGLLSSYFSKNMSVVLLIAMGTTAVFANNSFTEGFKEGVGHPESQNSATTGTATTSTGTASTGASTQSTTTASTPSNVVANAAASTSPEESATTNASNGQAAAAPEASAVLQTQGAVAGQQASQETPVTPTTPATPAPATTTTTTSENQQDGFTNPMRFCYQKQPDGTFRKKQMPASGAGIGSDGKVEERLCKGNNDQWGGGCYQLDTNANAWALIHQDVAQCMTQRGGAGGKDNFKWCPATGCPQGFSNMKKKSNTESKEARVDGVDESIGDRIDYANTMKQSMNNLQDMLGTDGMKGLAAETKKLVAQQKELVDSLGQMAPVLNSAKSTLDSLNLPDMKGITNILGVLKGGK